jgi:hypothetical protein
VEGGGARRNVVRKQAIEIRKTITTWKTDFLKMEGFRGIEEVSENTLNFIL